MAQAIQYTKGRQTQAGSCTFASITAERNAVVALTGQQKDNPRATGTFRREYSENNGPTLARKER
ncbi:MAG: hypothetical protein LUD76_03730 [Alistipes sp.]|nr:hypothetical protein [Alistipes sp.]